MSLAPKIAKLLGSSGSQIDPQFSAASAPPGSIIAHGGATPPAGWLLCYGQAVSRTTYAALFAAIDVAYGAGDGSTTFNLPDLRGRVAAGKDNMGGTAASRLTTAGAGIDGTALGAAGGAQTHTLTTPQMPSHTHNAGQFVSSASNNIAQGSGAGNVYGANTATTSAGSGNAHNNTQPTLVLNSIIKT